MLLTPEQLYEIHKIIRDHHNAFSYHTFGEDSVPPEVIEELKAKGLIEQSINSIGESYTYGQLLGTLENKKIAHMSYSDFKNHLRNHPVPLTPIERGAMEMAAQSAGQYCRGLGNRVDVATGAILIEADRALRARMEDDIRTATEENIAKRKTVDQLKSDLGWATKDWARDLKRIAVTEKVTAMNQGTSDHFKKRYGADTLVAKRAMPDACTHCQRLYNGPNGPRVFKLSTLEGNGTNVGRKANDWKAVVGSTHPNCQCVMIRVPAGWGWDEFGDLVPGGKVDMYESPEELELAMLQEDDLQKGFALQDHVSYQGIPIAIENKEGSVRKWTDVTGETGETHMRGVNYGYAQGTIGADGDEIDVFVGPDPRAKLVYVIEQQNPHTGIYDEQKCFCGFPNQETAERAYKLHYDNPERFIITVEPMEIDHFKRWIEGTKPQADTIQKSGPFIGPRGGKWADSAHTIPWKEAVPSNLRSRLDDILESPKDMERFSVLESGNFLVELDKQESDGDKVLAKKAVKKLESTLTKYLGKSIPTIRIAVMPGAATNLASGANASYDTYYKFIKINTKAGHNSLFHEYGHFLDHCLGNVKSSIVNEAFSSNKKNSVIGKFIDKLKATKSFKNWKKDRSDLDKEVHAHFYNYITTPTEMFARFFDQYIHNQLVKDGKNPKDFANNALDSYTRNGGAFSNADIEKLTPDFQKVIKEINVFFEFATKLKNTYKSDPDELKLIVLIPEKDALEKAGTVGGKYIRRVPYWKDGKKKYRYYYRESAIARDVKVGETIKLGKDFAQVDYVEADGTIHLKVGEKTIKVKANQWDNLLARHYGNAYFNWAEKRASQSVNAVLRHVPKEDLKDLQGTTDKERLSELKVRVPEVYGKLKKSFNRAGVNPFRAKQLLTTSLERRGWEPEARAAVIGDVITKRNDSYRTTIRAAENLAGGGSVQLGHVAAVTEIVVKAQNTEKDEIGEIATRAEAELAKLSELLAKAKTGTDTDKANVLAGALSSQAINQLKLIAQAFPGLADRAVEPVKEITEQVISVAPKAAPKSVGSSTEVYVAGEGGEATSLTAKYKLMEAEDVIASHDPKTFNKRTDYPEGVQERAYHRDRAEQAKVQRNAQRLKPAFVVNTNPDAVNGAPIMGPDGVVLGGNSRTMSVQLAYAKHPEKAEELKNYLREQAHQAGFTKEDVDQFKNPMLVRVVEHGGKTLEEKQLLVRQMNESFTQGMDPRTMQVALGRKITDETLEELGNAMDPDETLNEFLVTKRAVPFINALQKVGVIDQRNANVYFDKGTKKLNVDGKTLVARVLVGSAVADADLLSSTKVSLVTNLAQAVPYITQAKTYGEGFNLTNDLRVALDAYNSLQYRVDTKAIPALKPDMKESRFDELFAQQEMFGGAHPVTQNPKAMGLLEILIRRPGSQQITKVFKDYAEQAKLNPETQAGMFGPPKSATDIVKDLVEKNRAVALKEAAAKKAKKEKKEEQAQSDLLMSMNKGWGYFVGPRGGKWLDAKHTIPWVETKKETGRKELGKPGKPPEELGDEPALPGQIDIYEYVYNIKPKQKKEEDKKEPKKEEEKREPKQQELFKGGYYVGPNGYKWVDSKHTIPWKPVRVPVPKIKLTKGVAPEYATQNSQAGNRAPGPGLGINYVIPMPEKKNQGKKERGFFPGKDELIDPLLMDEEVGALHVDKEVYDFMETQRIVRPYEFPEGFTEAHEDYREGAEERRAFVKDEPIKNAGRPKNKVKRTPVKKQK